MRAAVNRQQAEINVLRQKLEETLQQLSSRNQRLTHLQETLSERKNTISDLRRQLRQVTKASGATVLTEADVAEVDQPEATDEPEHVEEIVVEEDADSNEPAAVVDSTGSEEGAVETEMEAVSQTAEEPDESNDET